MMKGSLQEREPKVRSGLLTTRNAPDKHRLRAVYGEHATGTLHSLLRHGFAPPVLSNGPMVALAEARSTTGSSLVSLRDVKQ